MTHDDHMQPNPPPGATEYTCSMHPEVRQSRPGNCPKCGMTLVPVTGASSLTSWATRQRVALYVLAAIALFYLWTEHRAHLLGALPWLILLACPLMHVFMHGGHGGHDGHAGHSGERTP